MIEETNPLNKKISIQSFTGGFLIKLINEIRPKISKNLNVFFSNLYIGLPFPQQDSSMFTIP